METIVLCILDGVGLRNEKFGNAFKQARTPFIDYLWNKYPHCKLEASGEFVGLPKGIIGNSEVGHTNIGAGRIIYQPSELINNDIKKGLFYKNKNLNRFLTDVKKNDATLHLIGLMSDAGVHSIIDHLFSILDLIKEYGLKKVYIHGISDGRDTPTTSGINYFKQLQKKLDELGVGIISTVSGRFYAMDRDNRWERVKLSYDCLTKGIGKKYDNYINLFNDNYMNNITDEFIAPSIIDEKGIIKDGDYVIDFNFRPDRLRELLSALTNKNFIEFKECNTKVDLLTMMPVSKDVICNNIYKKDEVVNSLGIYISNLGKKQLRIAETEKYAHVTYFFDGGRELQLNGCKRILVPSPKVETYDLSPNMRCKEITDKTIKEIEKSEYDLIILNYANGDMLGHTGNIEKTIESLETLDKCIEQLYSKVMENKGILILTADHGNCEYMLDNNGNKVTSHTTNKVPFIICKDNLELIDGKLSDIAPTILKIMDLKIPKEMTGDVLIK
ncbi:MAG: 2,3-bisphosphoglycerate-independent phosphoglycerate mutase [bacterium]|nr:2,3-bisphosphoglycerate-independent phosphoglycerate mutase [bacterium]